MLPKINTPDRQAEAYPVLTPAHIDRLRSYGKVRSVKAAEVLFEPGKSHGNIQVIATASTHPAQRRQESPWIDLAGHKVANHPR